MNVAIPAANLTMLTNWREFLHERYLQLKAVVDLNYSYRMFSKLAGFGSPNYLKLVIANKRNISVEAIPKFARGLILTSDEGKLFFHLVARDISQRFNSSVSGAFLEMGNVANP